MNTILCLLRPLVARLFGLLPCTVPAVLSVVIGATVGVAQIIPVQYGDPARSGSIASAGQVHRFLLSGTQGDTVRITFSSQNSGYPSYWYYHQLELRQGTTPVTSSIQGLGVLTATLPATGLYTIDVRARNNQATGWYAFQIDRMNDPVGAHRIAHNWNMRGSIAATAGFAVYTLRIAASGSGELRLTCQNSGYPSYWYHHYAELIDASGQQVASVVGSAASTGVPVTVTADGVYTLFVAARDYQSTGWYSVSVDCASWPAVPCDEVAYVGNYGAGSAGTLGVPSLTAANLPQLGTTFDLQIGNSAGQPTTALLLIGVSADNVALPAYGATLLVANPSIATISGLQPGGRTLCFPLPSGPGAATLLGLGLASQTVVVDSGATGGFAFSRGLLVLIGN